MAAALAIPTPKEGLISDAIASVALPGGVRLRRFYLDTDWTGDPCVRVIFGVSRRHQLTPARVRQLAEILRSVSSKLWELPLEEIPYVTFEDIR